MLTDHSSPTTAGKAVSISDRTDFRPKNFGRNKEDRELTIKRLILQVDTTVSNVNTPNNRTGDYGGQKWWGCKKQRNPCPQLETPHWARKQMQQRNPGRMQTDSTPPSTNRYNRHLWTTLSNSRIHILLKLTWGIL